MKPLVSLVIALLAASATLWAGQQTYATAKGHPARPLVGAIRWDAWSGGPVTEQVERTLGPSKYHDRLPWFAEVTESNRVRINGSQPGIMEREIDFAADAGLDYWAFLLYPESDSMSVALDHYRKSPKRHRINFCVILHNAFSVREAAWPRELDRLIALLKEPGYQTVLGGRPLVLEFQAGSNPTLRERRLTDFRRAAGEAGLNPYCVFMGWNPAADFARESTNGFDAVSAYAFGSEAPTFAGLVRQVETRYWQKAAEAMVPYVPLVTTGWDKQPRKENPVSWEKDHAYHRQAVFPARATPAEIASHLERALTFVQQHPRLCVANTVILYAWNEHDEGGWLAPTWTPGGKPDTARLEAIGGVLRAKDTDANLSQPAVESGKSRAATQYILFNRAPGQGMYQGNPASLGRKQFDEVLARFPNRSGARIQIGVSYVFSPFRTPPEKTVEALRVFLEVSEQTDTPVLVQIDLEHWWDARPDLWNWWDPAKPGFDLANRENVEWTGWSPDDAIKIAWRNWGRQIRVLPPPNLASPRYVAACRQEIRRLVPIVLDWHAKLPADKKHLFIGIKLGHETSVGVNAWHYPGGNALLARPASEDPSHGLKNDDVLARGVAQIGYAALKTSGLRTSGTPTESELRDVAQRYLAMLCHEAAQLGVPRDRLFTHGAGWKDGELIYDVPVNGDSCPGWSFYQHAADPRKDAGVQRNLAKSDAPYWAATEWLLQGAKETAAWRRALTNTLADPRCRYVCIFNWESIRGSDTVMKGIDEAIESRAATGFR